MVFGLDSDASFVLGLAVFVTILNAVFVSSIFVYFCCYVEVVSINVKNGNEMKSKNKKATSNSVFDHNNYEELSRLNK